MVKAVLVEAAIEAGARLLSELDRSHFPVDSMFWAQMPESGRWRLAIGSPLVRDQGQLVAYERVGMLLRENDLGLDPGEISAFWPDLRKLLSLLSSVERSGRVVAGASWVAFGEGIVYRWTCEAITGDLICGLTQTELSQIWERERKATNLPKLLFSVEARHLTIRFHPQNGRLSGLEDIKRPLQIALDRAHPDCRIEWC